MGNVGQRNKRLHGETTVATISIAVVFKGSTDVDGRARSTTIFICTVVRSTVFTLAQTAKSVNHGRKSDQGGQGNEHRFEGQHVEERDVEKVERK
jgi:hypothetical protein